MRLYRSKGWHVYSLSGEDDAMTGESYMGIIKWIECARCGEKIVAEVRNTFIRVFPCKCSIKKPSWLGRMIRKLARRKDADL